MSRRSRRRRHGRSRRWYATVAVVGVVVLVAVGSAGLPAASFSTADAARAASADVVVDSDGAHALDTAGAVHVNATDPLVNVTNRLGEPATVTVQLRSDSTHIGDLVVGGTVVGNETSFTLAAADSETVSIRIPDDSTLTDETVYFHVNASTGDLAVTASDRSAPVNA